MERENLEPLLPALRPTKRLVDRQTRKINIHRTYPSYSPFMRDFFHSLLHMDKLLFGIFFVLVSVGISALFGQLLVVTDRFILGHILQLHSASSKAFLLASSVLLNLGYTAEEAVPWDQHWISTLLMGVLSLVTILWSIFLLGVLYQKVTTGPPDR